MSKWHKPIGGGGLESGRQDKRRERKGTGACAPKTKRKDAMTVSETAPLFRNWRRA